MRRVGLLTLMVLMALGATGAQKPSKAPPAVAIKVLYGRFFPHEATVRVRVTVAPNRANQGLWIAIESDDYAGSHYEDLPGQDAPKTREWDWKDLPDGEYTAWAHLLKDHGEQSASDTFTVGAPEPEAF
jgi:hypothetical protein